MFYTGADGTVEWEKEKYCPTQNYTVRKEKVVSIPYANYDFCGTYTIHVQVLNGPECSANSTLYPIPDWQIGGDGKGCMPTPK